MKLDALTLIGIGLMIVGTNILILYYYNTQKAECTSNPLVYGAKQLEEIYSGVWVVGTVYLYGEGGARKLFFFNNSGMTEFQVK